MNWPTSIVIFLHLVPSSWGKQNSFIQLIQYNGSITGLSSCWCWSLYVTKSCKRFTCTVEWELHNQRSTILQSLLLGQIAFQRICVAFYLCTFYYFDHLNQTKSKQKKNQIPNFLWIIMSHKTVGNHNFELSLFSSSLILNWSHIAKKNTHFIFLYSKIIDLHKFAINISYVITAALLSADQRYWTNQYHRLIDLDP